MVPRVRLPSALLGSGNRLVSLSFGQIFAIGLSSVGGLIVWILAARMFAPVQVGRASSVITLGGLLSTIVAAGLGQYLLAALPAARDRGRLVLRVMAAGVGGSLLMPVIVGLLLYRPSGVLSILLLATMVVTVTLTTLQDALYVYAGSTKDIAAKAGSITLARMASLVFLGPVVLGIGDGASWSLVLLLAIPQLTVSIAWLLFRIPSLLSIGRSTSPARPTASMLSVGYAVALATASVTWGLPAVVTSELEPERAALFYASWVLGSIAGTVPASLANALVASAPAVSIRHIMLVVGAQLLVSVALLVSLVASAPWLSQLFGAHYEAMPSILPAVAGGQLAVGVSVVLIAYVRLAGRASEAVLASAALVLLASVAPAVVATQLGESQFLISFVIGSLGAVLLGALILMRRLRAPVTLPNG